MRAKKPSFHPFANEAEVIQVGNLTIENRLDRITLDGDVDLTLDQVGLAKATLLHQLLGEVIAAMAASPLPDTLPPPDVHIVDNPFN
ncbi:MAG: hypothetical protein H7335_04165 [Massilia sp.]|nr:hypothetical protein [Massilia sp.]